MQSLSPLPQEPVLEWGPAPTGTTGHHLPWGVQLSLASISCPIWSRCERPALLAGSVQPGCGVGWRWKHPNKGGTIPVCVTSSDRYIWTWPFHFRNEHFKSSRMQHFKNHVLWPSFPTRLSTLHHQPSESPTPHSQSNCWWKCLNTEKENFWSWNPCIFFILKINHCYSSLQPSWHAHYLHYFKTTALETQWTSENLSLLLRIKKAPFPKLFKKKFLVSRQRSLQCRGYKITQKANRSDVSLVILKSQKFWMPRTGDTKFPYRQLSESSNQSAW